MARFLKLTILRRGDHNVTDPDMDTVYLNIEHIVSISALQKSGQYPNGGTGVTMLSAADGTSECYYVAESMKTITDNLPN